MNSLVVKFCLGATLAGATLISSGQTRDSPPARNDVTLLTGPDMLSPASRPLNSPSISSEQVAPARSISELSLEEARHKMAGAQERLKKLRAERAAALARKQELDEARKADRDNHVILPLAPRPTTLPADPIRFDARMPVSTSPHSTIPPANPILFDARVPAPTPDLLLFDSTLHPSPAPPKFEFQRAAKP